MIVKTGCETDGSLHSTNLVSSPALTSRTMKGCDTAARIRFSFSTCVTWTIIVTRAVNDDDHNGHDCDGGDLLVPDDVLQHHELEGVVVAPALVTAQQHAGELA